MYMVAGENGGKLQMSTRYTEVSPESEIDLFGRFGPHWTHAHDPFEQNRPFGWFEVWIAWVC